MASIQQIKDAVDIVDIISERIDLKKSGSYFKARCPFHSEKTPSFFVSPELQRYKCFGCGASGDVINFLQEYEGMSFYEALKYLADRAGLSIDDSFQQKDDVEKNKLLEVLDLAGRYFHYLLKNHKVAQEARAYLKQRKISNTSIDLFQLGYSLPTWDGLIKFLHKKKKYSLDLLVKAGLVIKSNKGTYYDRFRGRIMFPLKDALGRIVGFSGRVLDPDAKEAKYINTPETLLYHKSRMLYGYHELFQFIKKSKEVIVCEGEFDVISSSQINVNNIVAIKGSALTKEQINILTRTVDRIILSLDSDNAGIKATKRAISLLKDSDVDLRVLVLNDETTQVKDADELIKKYPHKWREKTKNTISAFDFLINIALKEHDLDDPIQRKRFVNDLASIILTIKSSIVKDFYIKKIAKILNIRPGIVEQDMRLVLEKQNIHSKYIETLNQKTLKKTKQNDLNKFEKMLYFLFFKLDDNKKKQYIEEFLKFGVHPKMTFILNSLKSSTKNFDSLKKSFPDDIKDFIFSILMDEKLISEHLDVNLEQNFLLLLNKFKILKIREKIGKISKKIAKLEAKNTLTKQEQQNIIEYMAELSEAQKILKTLLKA